MSFRGVRQLKELVIRYSDLDGSSRGMREWIKKDLVELATANPQLILRTELKRCKHPFLRGVYANGNEKTIGVKNLEPSTIHDYALDLRNQIGRKNSSNGYKKPVLSSRPSIQGEWHERMDLGEIEFKAEHK
jgi:large subunit ribosomal protein L43